MKNLFLIIIASTILTPAFGQKEAENWVFGLMAGINFTSTGPVAMSSACTTTEGTTVASDANGNLLFYTDGVSVWDRVNTVMANGSGLFGNVSTTVSALTVPYPGNPNLHYIFTLDEATGTNGLCYSVVDMTLNNGYGDVTIKNIPLLGNVTEKMTAVKQSGTSNVWLAVHEWGTDAFYSYLITTAGLQTTPVVSNAGMVHTIDPLEQNKYGQMKFNTCGSQIALAIGYLDTVQVLNFNSTTGVFSNPITIPLGDHVYGVEFSHDGSMLYVTRYNTGVGYADLVQFDLTSNIEAVINASIYTINSNTSGTNFYYALQLALDEKIYVCTSWSTFLGVVNTPSSAGALSNYDPVGFDIDPNFMGASSGLGLPAFVQSYFIGEHSCLTSINEIDNLTIGITPTISNNYFTFTSNATSKQLTCFIYDVTGKMVEKFKDIKSGYAFGENLSAGVYHLNITDGEKNFNTKIVKLSE